MDRMEHVWIVFAMGLVPLVYAWRANRRTTLRDTIVWAFAAWISWAFALAHFDNDDLVYLALCLTGCAGVAVLGARRPHVFAWNFVVLGLLGVMVLPLLEGMVILVESFNIERKIFLAGILIVAIGNYLATRLAVAAISVAVACAIGMMKLTGAPNLFSSFPQRDGDFVAAVAMGAAPWLGWSLISLRQTRNALDADWFAFLDRFGFVWGSRIRDQFNAAAKNAELPMRLGWRGGEPMESGNALPIAEARSILNATTKRFYATN